MIYGLDLLGLAKYPKVALEAFPAGFALGAFSETFGDALPAVEALVDSARVAICRLHPMWKSRHDYGRGDFAAIVKEAKRCVPLFKSYPSQLFQISTGCEHRMNLGDATEIYARVKDVVPANVTAVNCPMAGGALIYGRHNEIHGSKVSAPRIPYNFSYDGDACVDSDVEHVKSVHGDCAVHFFWEPRFNGRWEANDTTPIEKRKGWPDADFIRSVAALANDKGTTKLPRNWIYKSHSENKGTGDRRAEMPVMIAPVKTSKIVLKQNGKVVHEMKYYGPYEDGRHRYYANKYGFQISTKPCGVWVGGERVGVISPAFREGSFR